ncbi:MAG: hypothetical protein RLZ25_1687 [Pseudomonadota bacterium]|jgi:hypothetical protein
MTNLKKLTLIVPPLLEEELIDRLLEQGDGLEFTAGTIYAHAADHESLSLIEQVTGRKRRIRFEIISEAQELQRLLDSLQERFKGSGIHYLLQSIERRGLL